MKELTQNTEQEKISSLEARVNSLERQLKRQKIARKNAESFLESYSRDAYLSNQALRKALNASKRRERELLFLNRAASQLTNLQPGQSAILSALEAAVEFSGASCGKVFIKKENDYLVGDDDDVLTPENQWTHSPELAKLLKEVLPTNIDEPYTHWCVTSVDRPDTQQEARVLHFMHEMPDGEYAWLVLLTPDDILDEETLYVLDTTKHYLNFNSRYQSKKSKLNDKQVELSSIKKDKDALEEKLKNADKMAMLGQLVAGIAHEINNPISYVLSNTEVAKEIFDDYQKAISEIGKLCEEAGGAINEKFREFEKGYSLKESANEIAEMFLESLEGIERIVDIIKALRSFSYSGSGKSVEINAVEAINSAIKLTTPLHRFKNKVILENADNTICFRGNAGQIQQVLVNLLTNAIYATPDGKCIYLSVSKNEESVVLIVEDEGIGMPKGVLDKIFTPFFTTKPPGEGTGLGMSISMTIIEEHGGTIDISSKPGKGTCVTVSFPLV